jgi:hypothetical protein
MVGKRVRNRVSGRRGGLKMKKLGLWSSRITGTLQKI